MQNNLWQWKSLICLLWGSCFAVAAPKVALAQDDLPALTESYQQQIQPLLQRYCADCHSGTEAAAEIDLDTFASMDDVRKDVTSWVRISELIRSRQMPPVDAEQLSDDKHRQLQQWLERYLLFEANRNPGDPGPVLLRRLSNSEYTYSLRDLTGVVDLDPASQFPVDAAAGEGFTNTGSGQGMSAAMAQKYIDAAKSIADHVQLLPDGIRFSQFQSRRDQTNELLTRIQQFYDQYTSSGGGTAVDLQGVKFETNAGGLIPLAEYLTAIATHQSQLREGSLRLDELATRKGLSAKYLRLLWEAMEHSPSPLLQELRTEIINIQPAEIQTLVARIQAAQQQLWQFNPVGQIGREGTANRWMTAAENITQQQHHELSLPTATDESVTVSLLSRSLTSNSEQDLDKNNGVLWKRPRLLVSSRLGSEIEIPLARLPSWVKAVETIRLQELGRSAKYLAVLKQEMNSTSVGQPSTDQTGRGDVDRFAELNTAVLDAWRSMLGVQKNGPPVQQPFTGKIVKGQSYDAINGWGQEGTPSILTNSSDDDIQFLTLTVPAKGVTVHPSPTSSAVVAWQSPTEVVVDVRTKFVDQDAQCGNGFAWQIQWVHRGRLKVLASGEADNGQVAQWKSSNALEIATGDLLKLVVSPRGNDHSCDTTQVQLHIEPADIAENVSDDVADTTGNTAAQPNQVWDLDQQVVTRILESNPLSDLQGRANVWHFGAEDLQPVTKNVFSEDSLLSRWQASIGTPECDALETRLVGLLSATKRNNGNENWTTEELQLRDLLYHPRGPLEWIQVAGTQEELSIAEGFGAGHGSDDLSPEDLPLWVGSDFAAEIPAQWLSAPSPNVPPLRLVCDCSVLPSSDAAAAVQTFLVRGPVAANAKSLDRWTAPILIHTDEGRATAAASLDEFRNLFPAALCYRRIVPVDEVVTLTLFHREDDHLQRLMLDSAQSQQLDRLWDQFLFVSQEPLQLVVALEQLIQFATQDRQDLVGPFEALRVPVQQRADEFSARQISSQPLHVQSIIEWTGPVWRRPLTSAETQQLQDFYQQLREKDLPHEEAIRLLIARVLSSPSFLFKLESVVSGVAPAVVTDQELATRLSYFLGSSTPDQPLMQAAADGRLVLRDQSGVNREQVLQQTRRLLQGTGTRRMAIEFACQWMHIRDFDQHNEKNERLFPEFVQLREDMYEESILFFAQMLKENRSVLEIIQSEQIFLNEVLADHYQLQNEFSAGKVLSDTSWRQVNVSNTDRGGVLSMASVLASQSGASRTSPILRGNWVYETLLGQKLPKPPAGVPVLPEEVPSGLSARQLIEKHSSDAACAKCHIRIDPYGFALEQFDVMGRLLQEADVRTTTEDGIEVEGVRGLRSYLLEHRQHDFLRQFSRKLLGFALGRPLQLSDEPLLQQIQAALHDNEGRIHSAIEVIVLSPQFTMKRGQDFVSDLER